MRDHFQNPNQANRTITRYVSATFTFLLFFTSCVPSLTTVKDVTMALPENFPGSQERKSNTANMSWNSFFQDESLASLIETGLSNNQELHIVEQEIQIANNEVLARQGEYIPKVDVGAKYGFEKVGKFTSQGAADEANGVPTYLQSGRIGLAMNWEVDIWKKLRNASKAAYYGYLSSIEGRKFLVTRLVAEISDTYYELLALKTKLQIIDAYVNILDQIRTFAELKKNAARASSLAVKRFEAEVYKNEARKYELRQKILVTSNHLNTLVGRFPQELALSSKDFLDLNLSPVHTGVPSSLLDNRPDIKAASFELEASKLSVASAKARFYPSLSIDAGLGFETFNSKHFLKSPESAFYGLGGSLTAPLLNRQAIKAAYFSANSRQIQAVYRYEQTLVKAYTEVVNQLNQINNLASVFDYKRKQLDALEKSIEISNILFQAARMDYIEALVTQRDALDARLELVETKQRQLVAYVDLYRSLGGGWKEKHAEIKDKKDSQ